MEVLDHGTGPCRQRLAVPVDGQLCQGQHASEACRLRGPGCRWPPAPHGPARGSRKAGSQRICRRHEHFHPSMGSRGRHRYRRVYVQYAARLVHARRLPRVQGVPARPAAARRDNGHGDRVPQQGQRRLRNHGARHRQGGQYRRALHDRPRA